MPNISQRLTLRDSVVRHLWNSHSQPDPAPNPYHFVLIKSGACKTSVEFWIYFTWCCQYFCLLEVIGLA